MHGRTISTTASRANWSGSRRPAPTATGPLIPAAAAAAAFGGLNTHHGTTTALITELPEFTLSDYVEALRASLDEQGWPPDAAEDVAEALLDLASGWEVGTVIERRCDWYAERLGSTPPR